MYTPKPFSEGFLPEEDGHIIYYAQYGNPDGEVIVNLHGGPGAHSKAKHAARFNLNKYQVVLFDQRGCGKSTPTGKCEDNTTQKSVSDMERLRQFLGLEKWFVSGGSWGSALALVYAETHPQRVKGLLVSAIFLADDIGTDWMNIPSGAGMLFTDLREYTTAALLELGLNEADGAEALYEKILVGSEKEQKAVAALRINWESNLLSALREVSMATAEEMTDEDVAGAKLFLHYETKGFFMEKEQMLKNIDAIREIPTIIVHGRYDAICPFEQAWKLHKALTNSEIVIVPQSNHQFTPDGEVARSLAFESFLKDFE